MKHFLSSIAFLFILYSCTGKKTNDIVSSADSLIANRNIPKDTICIQCVSGQLKTDIDSLKLLVKTIHINTLPPELLRDFIQSKLLDEIYNWVFHRSEANQILVFLISIIGLITSMIMIITLFYENDPSPVPFPKASGLPKVKRLRLNLFCYLAFFIVSVFLFVTTNRSHINDINSKGDTKSTLMETGSGLSDSTSISQEDVRDQLRKLSAQIDSTQKLIKTVDVEAAIKSNKALERAYIILTIAAVLAMSVFYFQSLRNRRK